MQQFDMRQEPTFLKIRVYNIICSKYNIACSIYTKLSMELESYIHAYMYIYMYIAYGRRPPLLAQGSRHDLTLVVRSQTKRQQSAHSVKHQGLHSCHN